LISAVIAALYFKQGARLMGLVKTVHVICVLLSFAGFFVRGVWMLRDSELLRRRWVRITPQAVDTLLLVSAIVLAIQLRLSPMEQPWLMAKIIALVVYIGVGLVALKLGRSKQVRLYAWLLGLLLFGYIISVAVTKSAMGWFVII
jgi:uncharacterized membrane protein SirB2